MAFGIPTDRVGDGDGVGAPHPLPSRLPHGEREPRRPDAHYQAMLDALPGHVAILDVDGAVVSVNASWQRDRCVSGPRSMDLGIGENYPTLCEALTGEHAEDSRRAARGIRSVLSGQAADFSMQYHCHSPAEDRWFRMSVTALPGDVLTGALVMHLDISESKRAEQAIRQSNELLRALVDGTPDVVFVKDREGRYLLCNEAGARFAGLAVETMVGHHVDSIFGADDARLMMEGDRRVIVSGLVQTDEEVIGGAGTTRTVLTTKAPYRDEHGEVIGVIGIVRDITERKQAERERERQLLRTLIDAIPDLVYTKDGGGRFTVCNRATLSYFGFEQEQDMLGKTLFDLLPADVAERLHAADQEVLAGRPMLNLEERILDRSGAWQWHSKIKLPLHDAVGEVTGLVSISRNTTGLRRGQDALRELNSELEERVLTRTDDLNKARQEAEHANRAKSAFLATMSHEIRTPMNGVIGMLDVLHRTSLKGYQVEMVDLIRDSAFSLLRIIEDVLDFSKIEAGKLSIEQEPMQLADTVEKVCAMLDQMAVDRGAGISMFVDPAIPRTVSGDETRLRQVLVNLISNAIKFSGGRDQPGQVSVRVVLVKGDGDDVTVDLIVADNGIGMDESTLARLFTPFSQADVSTTRRFGGSGLGLAITEMLVHVMGGAISVQSVAGQGSTFTVHLPLTAVADTGAEEQPVPVDPLRCRIVGDEQPLADDLAATLAHAGHHVERSPDLAAAARAAQPPGLWLWLILPGPPVPLPAELRAMAPGGSGAETRFI
ncbi:MAG: PAS domain-containing protein, partial [Caldimonas sp.]